MNFGNLLFNLQDENKKLLFRKYEALNKKLINAENAITFNKTYIYIYIHN